MKAVLCAYKDGIKLMAKDKKQFHWFLCPDNSVKVDDFVLVEYKIQKRNKKTKKKISTRFFAVEKVVRVVEDIQYDKAFLEKRKIMDFVLCKLEGDMDEIGKQITKCRRELIDFYQGKGKFNDNWKIVGVKHKLNIRWDLDRPNKIYNFVSHIPVEKGDYVIVEYRKVYPKFGEKKLKKEYAEVNHFGVARVEELVETNESSLRDICPIAFIVAKIPVRSLDNRIAQVRKFKELYYKRYMKEEPYAKRKRKPKPSKGYWQKRKAKRKRTNVPRKTLKSPTEK